MGQSHHDLTISYTALIATYGTGTMPRPRQLNLHQSGWLFLRGYTVTYTGCRVHSHTFHTSHFPHSHLLFCILFLTLMPDTVVTVEHSTYLWCIAINNQRQVLSRRAFQIMAPLDSVCEIVFVHLRIAVPSLRSRGYQSFSLHKPRVVIKSSNVPASLSGSQVDFDTPLRREAFIRDMFPPPLVLENRPGNINAIICLGAYLFTLPANICCSYFPTRPHRRRCE